MNMAEAKYDLLLCGWMQFESHRNGWITFCRRFRAASTFSDPEYHYCTLFTSGRIVSGIIRPKKKEVRYVG